VARFNFSHDGFEGHARRMVSVREAAEAAGRRVGLLADLPGPKMRIGEFADEAVTLEADSTFFLTTDDIVGSVEGVSVTFAELPEVVRKGDRLFLNDGLVQLEVIKRKGATVVCRVLVGGELRARKGLNLPGIDLGVKAFTDRDRECLAFALEQGVDAVSQSFVEGAADIEAVRKAAIKLGRDVFIVAKIERARAVENLDDILEVADGIMVARGDLGVEMPIEQMAAVQKSIIRRANLRGVPVITATQMLESMTHSRLPTRAEATDVANAVLDGTDAVMLSGESAMGRYPVDAVAMLAKIAADAEEHRPVQRVWDHLKTADQRERDSLANLVSLAADAIFERTRPVAAVARTEGGWCARGLARFKLPVWVFGVSRHETTCQALQFCYGVHPVRVEAYPDDWSAFARDLLAQHGIEPGLVVLSESPTPDQSRMGLVDLA
jgi:pyruvate kinase